MNLVVRRIEPGEGADLKVIRLAALTDSPFAFGSTYAAEAERADDEWDLRAERSAAGHQSALFLAWSGDQAVGIVGAYRPDETPSAVELVSMWTAPEVRRSGVARRLVSSVIDWASSAPTESVSLWLTSGNAPAQALYESMGFRRTVEQRPLPSDPSRAEIRMRLECERLALEPEGL